VLREIDKLRENERKGEKSRITTQNRVIPSNQHTHTPFFKKNSWFVVSAFSQLVVRAVAKSLRFSDDAFDASLTAIVAADRTGLFRGRKGAAETMSEQKKKKKM
jgi:hypothetical protein